MSEKWGRASMPCFTRSATGEIEPWTPVALERCRLTVLQRAHGGCALCLFKFNIRGSSHVGMSIFRWSRTDATVSTHYLQSNGPNRAQTSEVEHPCVKRTIRAFLPAFMSRFRLKSHKLRGPCRHSSQSDQDPNLKPTPAVTLLYCAVPWYCNLNKARKEKCTSATRQQLFRQLAARTRLHCL